MRIHQVVMSRREALLAVATIVSLGAIAGALFGAARAQEQQSHALAACEASSAMRCMIVAVPLIPRTERTSANGESPNVP